MILVSLSTFYYPYFVKKNSLIVSSQEERLAIASDVILCAKYRWSLFSGINIKENASDTLNDNPLGIPMDVFSLDPEDIIYHRYRDVNEDFEIVMPTSGVSRFIMPYNYYNRPWYMWPGSTINMTLKIHSSKPPKKATVYLFKGEKKINNFFSNDRKFPAFEEEMDFHEKKSNDIFWTIEDNDYYYMAVHFDGEKGTVFQSNITFDFKYIDIDEYSWLPDTAKHVQGVGKTVTFKPHRSRNITLCYLHPLNPNSLESDSIHIQTSYSSINGNVL